MKPVSQPCLRNQAPIYQALCELGFNEGTLLELGCGTAQHGVYMASRMPRLNWIATDTKQALEGANMWIKEADLPNLALASELDINTQHWPHKQVDYVYSANLVHFVSMESAEAMFRGIERSLCANGHAIFYGPFNDKGFTSEGNERLDEWLKTQVNKLAGIKEISVMNSLAQTHGLMLIKNILMPANNHLLIFKKTQ